MFETDKTTEIDFRHHAQLVADEVDAVAGGKVIAIIVLAGCTDPFNGGRATPV